MLFKSGNNDITAEGVKILLTNKWNKLKFLDLGNYPIMQIKAILELWAFF